MESDIEALFLSSVNMGQACIQVFDLTQGKTCIKSYRGICSAHKTLCAVGLSDYIICGQKDRPLLQAWSLNQTETLQIRFPIPGRVNVMSTSQCVDQFCALGVQEKIYIYQMNTGLQIGMIERHYQDVTCLAFTPCGNYFASSGNDGFVYLWSKMSLIESLHKSDRPQIQPHYILGQHSDKVNSVSISKAGMRGILVSCSSDHSAKVFDLVTGRLRHNVVSNCPLTCCEINSVGSQIFCAGGKGRVWGFNLLPHSCKLDLEFEGPGTECHSSLIHHMVLTSAGDSLVTGGADGEVKLWSIVMTERKNSFGVPSLVPQTVIWSGKGNISNLMIMNVDKEVFSLSSLQSKLYLSSFTKDGVASDAVLNATIRHPVRKLEEKCEDETDMLKLAFDIYKGSNSQASPEKTKKKKKLSFKDESLNETDLLAHIKTLEKKNDELYKFCLKHLLGED